MRIAFLGDPNNIHTRRWVNFFANRGHSCAIFCDPPVMQPFEGVEIICPRMSLPRKTLAFKVFRHQYSNNLFKAGAYGSAVGHWGADIVHGFEALEFGYAMANCRRRPRVLTPWGNDIFDSPKKSKLARYLVNRALHRATAISTNAPGLEDYLQREYGINPRKVDCFSWGADLRVFNGDQMEYADAFGRRIGLPDDAFVILSPRTMKPYWGVGLIADALGEIVERVGPKAVIVFLRGAGDASYEAELRGKIDRAGLSLHTRFVSEVLPPAEMAAAYSRAEVFISAPETDLLSCTVVEAMACGCVPILADLPSYASRVEDGRNGFYIGQRTASAIAQAVFRAYAMRQRLGEIGQSNIKKAAGRDDWNHCAERMHALYERLLK